MIDCVYGRASSQVPEALVFDAETDGNARGPHRIFASMRPLVARTELDRFRVMDSRVGGAGRPHGGDDRHDDVFDHRDRTIRPFRALVAARTTGSRQGRGLLPFRASGCVPAERRRAEHCGAGDVAARAAFPRGHSQK